jgi:SAM-dependent methyltransferase
MISPTPVHPAAAVGFERGAADYEASRPSYPDAAVGLLVDRLGLEPGARVLDLAAGTGKFTRLLRDAGLMVVAAEPVAAMRRELARVLPGVPATAALAEALPFEAGSFAAVTAAQAFHWFSTPAALVEIRRVLRPGGGLALLWNEREERVDWVRDLYAILLEEHERGYEPREDWAELIAAAGGFEPLEHTQFEFAQQLSRDELVALAASRSYVSSLDDEERGRVLDKVRDFIDTRPEVRGRDEVTFPYATDVYWCRRS